MVIEPTMYLLIAIAEENDIEPNIYDGQDEELADYDNVKSQINKKKQDIRKDSVPASILQRVKTLPKLEEMEQQSQPTEEPIEEVA